MAVLTSEAAPGAAARPVVFGIRRSAIFEIVGFLALALVFDALFLDGKRLSAIDPHPFWAIVLLAAVQYGTSEGLLAAILSAAALLIGNVPEQRFGQDLYDWLLSFSIEPLLWILAAVAFGELREGHRRERDRLSEDLAATRKREETLASSYRGLETFKNVLEERVAGQLRTVFSVYNAAKSIEKLGTGEVLLGISDLVRAVIGPRKFSVFLLNGGVAEAATCEGWTPDDTYSRTFDDSSLLFQEVIGARRLLNATVEADQRKLAGQGVLAGPLTSIDTGEVVGMLKVEDIEFLDLNLSTVQNFRLLCEWIGTSFATARRFEEVSQALEQQNQRERALPSTFESQTRLIGALGRRMKFDVSMVSVSIANAIAVSGKPAEVHQSVVDTIRGALRESDIFFDRPNERTEYVVVMPGASLEQAEIGAKRMKADIEKGLAAVGPNLEVSTAIHALDALHGSIA